MLTYKASMQSQLPKVSTKFVLVLLEFRLGLIFFRNESLFSVSITISICSALKISASFTSLEYNNYVLISIY